MSTLQYFPVVLAVVAFALRFYVSAKPAVPQDNNSI